MQKQLPPMGAVFAWWVLINSAAQVSRDADVSEPAC
jgi:hypothetical protein